MECMEGIAMQPTTHYAKSGDIHIAYQMFGEGRDLVMAPGFVSHIENYWDDPRFARWLNRLGSFCRVVLFDKRGTGLSDRVAHLPPMDERMETCAPSWTQSGLRELSSSASPRVVRWPRCSPPATRSEPTPLSSTV